MTTSEAEKSVSDKSLTTIIYALYALSVVIGVSCLVAIIINYVKRDDVRGTWLESHFRWQIRTFWFSLLWGIIGGALTIVLVGFAIMAADVIWVIYRLVKGFLNLNDGKPMYA